MENSIEEDMKILEGIIKGDENCINAIYSQMKVKNDNDEDIQYYKKEIQSIKNIVNNYLKEKARADKLEKEYSIMLSQLDEREINYKRVLKENERYKKSDYETICLENNELREITDRIQSEYNDLLKDNFKLKNELETKRKEYQETYKDVREELRELRKENEELHKEIDQMKSLDIYKLVEDWETGQLIPIQKVKDKIEEIGEKIEYEENEKVVIYLHKQKNILQELLESEE